MFILMGGPKAHVARDDKLLRSAAAASEQSSYCKVITGCHARLLFVQEVMVRGRDLILPPNRS
jgi:hypothetical protein